MMRAVRFAARFSFHLDPQTEEAIQKCAPFLFPAVAKERIYQEFSKMEDFSHFGQVLSELFRLGLLVQIFPALFGTHLHDFKHLVSSLPEEIPLVAKLRELLKHLPLETQLSRTFFTQSVGERARADSLFGRGGKFS